MRLPTRLQNKIAMLYYSHPQVVFQEVPNEISLALAISGCPLGCKGCHSSHTWQPTYGLSLTHAELQSLIDKNKYISCVLFYGGEWQLDYLLSLIDIVKRNALRVCLFTGLDYDQVPHQLLSVLDYVKVGRYIEELGGLKSHTTNQRFLRLTDRH